MNPLPAAVWFEEMMTLGGWEPFVEGWAAAARRPPRPEPTRAPAPPRRTCAGTRRDGERCQYRLPITPFHHYEPWDDDYCHAHQPERQPRPAPRLVPPAPPSAPGAHIDELSTPDGSYLTVKVS